MSDERRVGIVGVGAMGRGIAATLLREFATVVVYDTDAGRLDRMVRTGAEEGSSVAEIASACDTILLSLPSSPVASKVIETEIAPNVQTGTVVIDTGTTKVAQTRRLAGILRDRGAHLLDAPVSGGPIGTAKGQLYMFVGGDPEVARSRWPLLKLLAKQRLTYCGPSGAGQIVKGVNQLAMGLTIAAMTEAVAYGVASGVDEAILLEAVGGNGGFRSEFDRVASQIAAGLGDGLNYKYSEYDYFLEQADAVGFAAPMMRGINDFVSAFPRDQMDNIHRAHPSLWGALTGTKERER